MKKIILLAVTVLISVGLSGCGEKPANTEEPAKNLLKPGDVSPDKAVAVKDLVDSAKADKDAWKGKEVAVNAYVTGTSGSGGKFGYSLTLKNDQKASSSENLIACKVPEGDMPRGLLSKTVEVKGTIKEFTDTGISIRLDPCELKNQQ